MQPVVGEKRKAEDVVDTTPLLPQKKSIAEGKDLRKRLFYKYFGEKQTVGFCLCCGERFTIVDQWHSGHIVSKARGGTDLLSNRVPLCAPCNNNDNNQQNQLDYMFKMKHGTHWLERLLKTVMISRLLYIDEERHKATFNSDAVETLHAFAMLCFGGGEERGGIASPEIFGLLQRHENLAAAVEAAKARYVCASSVLDSLSKNLVDVTLEKQSAHEQLIAAQKRYRQFLE